MLPFTTITTTKTKTKTEEMTMAFKQKALSLIIILISFRTSYGGKPSDVESLLQLRESMVDNSNALASWDPSRPPCSGNKNNWVGLICSRGGSVYGIRLENLGLSGKLDVDSLVGLSRLRAMSFMHNNFGGTLPEIKKLKALKAVFLSYNNFEGPIDANAFVGMNRLRKVHLDHNKFSGEIPASLAGLKKLVELKLEQNQFQGKIPDFKQPSFTALNLSNNQLEGPIPENLAKMDPSAFKGNKALCGGSLSPCPQPTPPQSTPLAPTGEHQSSNKSSTPIVPIIIAAVVVAVVAILVIAMIARKKSSQNEATGAQPPSNLPKRVAAREMDQGDEGSQRSTTSMRNKGENGKLCFVREDREKFDLPDLLKASAEILGSGCFGSSYKANLMSGSMVVVKRYKQMNNVGREDFQEHMRRIGRLDHPNLLPIVAYYYRKEEKLLISDFVQKGSLAGHLHGNSRGQPTLDWPTRLKVIKGVAKSLAYLYKELPSLVAPHGHLKSSNILLNESFEPMLNDYGLIPLINQESAQDLMVAYKSPEYINNGRITKKTDVWCLGILIIETITGEFPATYLQRGIDQADLISWVNTVVGGEEGLSSKVFDKNMTPPSVKNSEGEMQKLLKIGLACCESDVDKRLDIKEACERIEEVRERDHDDDFYSSYTGDADVRSSRGLSDDFTVIIN
ncbi:actin-regulating kinase prk1 [Ancistrocladus abbreviatus]